MDTTIRPATLADAPALAELMIEAAAYHAAVLAAIFRQPESPVGMIEFAHKLLADPQSRILAADQPPYPLLA